MTPSRCKVRYSAALSIETSRVSGPQTAGAQVLRRQVVTGVRPASAGGPSTGGTSWSPEPQAAATPAAPAGPKATVGPDGMAVAPQGAPAVIQQIIAAGNVIARKPYKYG